MKKQITTIVDRPLFLESLDSALWSEVTGGTGWYDEMGLVPLENETGCIANDILYTLNLN